MELQASLANLTQQKLGLAAISYDSPAILKSFAERTNITFPLLSDPDSRIIRAWGILNETVPAASPFYGIPYPGVFILDPSGVVVAKYFEDDYRERYTASEILMRQFGVAAGSAQMQSETKHLRLSTSVSLATVKWGQRIALVVDVDLKPKMHVYAPGFQSPPHYLSGLSEDPSKGDQRDSPRLRKPLAVGARHHDRSRCQGQASPHRKRRTDHQRNIPLPSLRRPHLLHPSEYTFDLDSAIRSPGPAASAG